MDIYSFIMGAIAGAVVVLVVVVVILGADILRNKKGG